MDITFCWINNHPTLDIINKNDYPDTNPQSAQWSIWWISPVKEIENQPTGRLKNLNLNLFFTSNIYVNQHKIQIKVVFSHFLICFTTYLWKALFRVECLQWHSGLACLEIRSRNEEAINSTRNMIYSLKVFYFLLNIDVDTFYLFLNWLSTRVSDDQKYLCGSRLYACINTWKFKGLNSREITSLPNIEKVIYMARHFNHCRK